MVEMKNRIKYSELKALKLTQLKEQDWCCAICGKGLKTAWSKEPLSIHWDHCHETGFMRGVVCRTCNIVEGKAWNSYCRQTKKDKRTKDKYLKIIKGLSFYYDNFLNKELIHPTFKTPEEKKELAKKRAKRKRKAKQQTKLNKK